MKNFFELLKLIPIIAIASVAALSEGRAAVRDGPGPPGLI